MAKKLWAGTSTPGDWSVAGNWSASGVPATGDDVYLQATTQGATAGLGQSAVTLATLTVLQTFTGEIGTAAAYLAIGATNWRIGDPAAGLNSSAGSGRIKVDFGSAQFTGVVTDSAESATDTNVEPVQIKGTHASNKLYVIGGRVGVATAAPGETATLAEFSLTGSDGVLNLGAGVTWTNGYQTAGALSVASAGTLLVQETGTLTVTGTGNITTLKVGGAATLNNRPASGAAYDTLEVLEDGVADFSGDARAVTVTTLILHQGAQVLFNRANPTHLTVTNAIQFKDAGSLAAA